MMPRDLRAFVREIASASLRTFPVEERLRTAIARRGTPGACDVFAVGKAAETMFAVAENALGGELRRALVVAPPGATAPESTLGVVQLVADHPTPSERSVAAANEAIRFFESETPIVVLLSGGTSALLAKPAPGISLETKRAVTETLLASGAPIASINVLRRHLSQVKGGGLVAERKHPVTTLVLSDVVVGGLHDVGSGPTVPDPTTIDDARAALANWAPSFASLPLRETLGPGDPPASLLEGAVVGGPEDLARHVGARLRDLGITAEVLEGTVEPASELSVRLALAARALRPGHALVMPAEAPVALAKGAGRGGRASHLAALVLRSLPPDVVFAAIATDGKDGSSEAAGAIVQGRDREDPALFAAITAAATADYFASSGEALSTGPTGLNFADLLILAR